MRNVSPHQSLHPRRKLGEAKNGGEMFDIPPIIDRTSIEPMKEMCVYA